MKKIFILTGEPSGDKLASKVIKELKKNHDELEYLCVGGENLQALGIKSIYDYVRWACKLAFNLIGSYTKYGMGSKRQLHRI